MMDIYDFGSDFAETFKKKCECGKSYEISTQRDTSPEYYTEVYVRCDCGKSVKFTLPVN